jgi:predicted metal-binding membrane protein
MQAGTFAAGYLAIWVAFSLTAAGVQWVLDQTATLTSDMKVASTVLSGAILVYRL